MIDDDIFCFLLSIYVYIPLYIYLSIILSIYHLSTTSTQPTEQVRAFHGDRESHSDVARDPNCAVISGSAKGFLSSLACGELVLPSLRRPIQGDRTIFGPFA